MRRNIDNIEIKEPPLEELKKKSSCLKHSCLTGCGGIFFIILASLIILKFSDGSHSVELKSVPNNFPQTIPVYDKDNIDRIIFTPTNQASLPKKLAIFVPKFILSPGLLLWEKHSLNFKETLTWNNLREFIKEPPLELRDTVEIQWGDLSAEPRFIEKYYKNELTKNKYQIQMISDNENNYQFNFKNDNIEGVFYLTDNSAKNGTDFFSLTIKIPKE